MLTPAEPPLDVENMSAAEALARLREMVAQAGGMNKTVDEIVEELRAIRKEIWERELRPKYAEALERYYAKHPDRRPRQQ